METVSLGNALALLLLMAEFDPERWPRAAARWLGRFIVETSDITLNEAALAAAALQGLGGPDRELAAQTLRQLAARHGLGTVVQSLR
jgi:hypothetical protein